MNKSILSLAAISALAVSSFAASDLAGAFKEGKVSGQIRAAYISDDFRDNTAAGANKPDQATTAIGGKLKFETAPLHGVSAGVSFFTTNALSGDESTKRVENTLDGSGKGYSLLGEAYIVGQFAKTTVKVGRQQIDTPLAGSDDVRMIPNLFDAALIINTDVPNTTIIAGHVARMAGLDSLSGTSYGKFNSMSASALNNTLASLAGAGTTVNSVGIDIGDHGVNVLAAINSSVKDLTLQAWYYNAVEVLNAYYLQADYKLGGLTLSGQYYNIDDTGKTAAVLKTVPAVAGGANYSVYGVKAAYAVESIGLTPYIAYNGFSKKSNGAFVNGAWGGYPEFAAMEEWTTNSNSSLSDAKLLKVGADYSLEKLGLGNRTLSVAYGKYDYAAANTDTNIIDVALTCDGALIKNLAAKIAYEKVDAGSAATANDQTFFKVIFNYSF